MPILSSASHPTQIGAETTGVALASKINVDLDEMLDRCRDLETRAAALYRTFAAGAREHDLCVLWTSMAREEEEHAHILDDARTHLPTVEAWVTHISGGWPSVVQEVEAKLLAAELLAADASADQQLAAALELEMTEIEPLRQMLVAVSQHRPPRPIAESHALRLAEAAERLSTDPHVRQQATLLRDRVRPTTHHSHA
jgi:rubrerythrin